MSDNQKFTHVYSGTEVQVIILKNLLENANILGVVQNDFQAGIAVGFGSGSFSTVRLKIHEADLEKATPIIEEFIANQ